MAKSLKLHQEHMQGLAALGKDLARRSGRKCELCHQSGVSLTGYEVIHHKPPQLDACIFICDDCLKQLKQLPRFDNYYWRCLSHSLWSEVKIVQAVVVALLQMLNTDWSNELLEQVYIDEEMNDFIITVKKSLI
jgi:protein PhnA